MFFCEDIERCGVIICDQPDESVRLGTGLGVQGHNYVFAMMLLTGQRQL